MTRPDSTRRRSPDAPDLLILGLDDPRLDCGQLLRTLATASAEIGEIPALGVTARPNDNRWHELLDLGLQNILVAGASTVEARTRVRSLVRLGRTAREVRRQLERFARFVSEETRQLTADDLPLPTPGEHRDLAIVFTDLRGFTQFASEYDPARIFAVLSSSLNVQVALVLRNGGHVDTIHGDGMLAYFAGPDRVERAIQCTLEIQAHARTDAEFGGSLTPPVGLAIHAGPVLLGMLGAPHRMDHTIIGDTVNVCARLSGVAKPFQIVASTEIARIAATLGDVPCVPLGPVALKGKPEPLAVFEIARETGARPT